MSEAQLQCAAQVYLDRKVGKSYPDGRLDIGKRWYPNAVERQLCCIQIREPSRAWPQTLQVHCQSAGHVARLFDVNELELKRAARVLVKASKLSGAV